MHVFFIRPEQALIQVFSLVLRIRSKASIEEKKQAETLRRKKGVLFFAFATHSRRAHHARRIRITRRSLPRANDLIT